MRRKVIVTLRPGDITEKMDPDTRAAFRALGYPKRYPNHVPMMLQGEPSIINFRPFLNSLVL